MIASHTLQLLGRTVAPQLRTTTRSLSSPQSSVSSAAIPASTNYKPINHTAAKSGFSSDKEDEESGVYMWGVFSGILSANIFVINVEMGTSDSDLQGLATAKACVEETSLKFRMNQINGRSPPIFVKKSNNLIRMNYEL